MLWRRLLGDWEAIALVAVGGALGATLRHGAGVVTGETLVPTLVANAVGSFALGLLLFDARADDILTRRLRYVFGTGLLASFTTYSTFVADVALTAPALAVVYVGASYAAGFGGVLASRRLVAATATAALEGSDR